MIKPSGGGGEGSGESTNPLLPNSVKNVVSSKIKPCLPLQIIMSTHGYEQ